jgi:hypothetical protein
MARVAFPAGSHSFFSMPLLVWGDELVLASRLDVHEKMVHSMRRRKAFMTQATYFITPIHAFDVSSMSEMESCSGA